MIKIVIRRVAFLLFIFPLAAQGQDTSLSKTVNASASFTLSTDASWGYPKTLLVFLNLKNRHDSDVVWVSNPATDIECRVIDSKGRPIPPSGPFAASVGSNPQSFRLPFGSSLHWLISHGGISMTGDRQHSVALQAGGHGWLIPENKLSAYSIEIRLKGFLRETKTTPSESSEQILIEIPPTQIVVDNVGH